MRVLALLTLCWAKIEGERFPIKILHDIARDGASAGELPLDSIYRLTATDIDGTGVSLSNFKGKVALVVNLASK
jgi:hypothetical protein